MPAVLLVVPVGPTPHELLPSLVALRAATRDRDVETRVVDLYVDPERRAGLVELVAGWARCDLVDAGPCGPGESPAARALRVALPTSRAGLVAVVAPRTLLVDGALSRLRAHLERDPGVALVAPLVVGAGPDALPPTPGAGFRALDAVAREAGADRTAVLSRPRAGCLVLRRAALEDAGLERAGDLEGLSTWLRAAGWQAALALDVVVQPDPEHDPPALPGEPAPGVAALREAAAVASEVRAPASWRERATGALRRATGRGPALGRPPGRLEPARRDVERLRRPGVLALNLLVCPLPRVGARAASRLEVERAAELAEALGRRDVDARLVGVEPFPDLDRLAGEPAVYRDADRVVAEAPDADAWLAVGHAAGGWLPALAGRSGLKALRLEDDDALAAPPGDPARARLEAVLAAAGRVLAPSQALRLATRPLLEQAWPLVAGGGAEPDLDLRELRPGARPDLFRPSARAAARTPREAALRLRVELDPEAPSRGGAWALREAFARLARPAGLQVVATEAASGAAGVADLLVELPREPAARAAVVAEDDLFVDPEPRRAPSAAAREALAAGLACVLVDPGDASLADGREALLVPPRDPAALAGALARLLGDPALRARLGEGARAWARAWTLDDEAAALLEALRAR